MNKYLLELTIVAFIFFAICLFAVYSGGLFHTSLISLDNFAEGIAGEVRSPSLTALMFVATYMGNWQTVIGVLALVIITFLLLHDRRDIAMFLVSIFLGFGLAFLLKVSVGRGRPDEGLISAWGASFPSAHALISTILYGLIADAFIRVSPKRWYKVAIIVGTTLLVVIIGLSRVYLNIHWFSDVLAGWFLGAVILFFFIGLFERFERKKFLLY